MSCENSSRDLIDPAIERGDQLFTQAQVYQAGETFTAKDEWCQLKALNPGGVAGGYVYLLRDGEPTPQIVGEEPFFVAGEVKYTLLPAAAGGFGAFVQRGKRRELFSQGPSRDYADNGAAYREAYSSAGLVVLGALSAGTNWLYLDASMQWVEAAIGVVASAPFGYLGANKDLAGRYYDIFMSTSPNVGVSANYFVSRAPGGAVTVQSLTGGGATVPSLSVARVGDNAISALGTGAYTQSQILGVPNWTIAIQNNVAATISGDIRVVRRGF